MIGNKAQISPAPLSMLLTATIALVVVLTVLATINEFANGLEQLAQSMPYFGQPPISYALSVLMGIIVIIVALWMLRTVPYNGGGRP